MRLEKAIGFKGKQPCKHRASETQNHSQSFQKRKWLEWARNSFKWQDISGKVRTWTEMYLNDWTFLWMAGKGLEWQKRAGNSWKQKWCLLLQLWSTHTQQFYWTFAALCLPSYSLATSPYAKKVWMLCVSTASVLSRTGPSCGSALKWALADWCCYGFCRLESQNQQCLIYKLQTEHYKLKIAKCRCKVYCRNAAWSAPRHKHLLAPMHRCTECCTLHIIPRPGHL